MRRVSLLGLLRPPNRELNGKRNETADGLRMSVLEAIGTAHAAQPTPLPPRRVLRQNMIDEERPMPMHDKPESERAMLLQAIKSLRIFAMISPLLHETAVDAFTKEPALTDGQVLVRDGEQVNLLYIVGSGRFHVTGTDRFGLQGQSLRVVERGGCLTESALIMEITDVQRTALFTISASGSATVYSLHRNLYARLLLREQSFFTSLSTTDFLRTIPGIAVAEQSRAGWFGLSRAFDEQLEGMLTAHAHVHAMRMRMRQAGGWARSTPRLDTPLAARVRRIDDATRCVVRPLLAAVARGMEQHSFTKAVFTEQFVEFIEEELADEIAEQRAEGVTGSAGDGLIIKAGTLCLTLKRRRDPSDSSIIEKKISLRRGDVISAEAFRAVAAGMKLGRIACELETELLTVLQLKQPQSDGASVVQNVLEGLMETQYMHKLLSQVSGFSSLMPHEMDELITRARWIEYKANETVVREGTISQMGTEHATVKDGMHVIFSGTAVASRTVKPTVEGGEESRQLLGHFDMGEQFGANALFQSPEERRPRSVTVIAQTHLKCLVFDLDALGDSTERVTSLLEREVNNRRWQLEHWGKVPFEDLAQGRMMGSGTSGRVYLAPFRPKAQAYAVKVVPKMSIRLERDLNGLQNERALLAACNHPHICRLVAGYHCPRNLYFVMELVEGGELFALQSVQPGRTFSVDAVRFYAANALAALTHLHDLNVVHRDIKSENLMLERDGYLKLIDLGFTKQLAGVGRTVSFCGTPFYMAPEICTFVPHGLPVDVWALGILIYELLTGELLFGNDAVSPTTAFLEIIAYSKGETSLAFPWAFSWKSSSHAELQDLILQMLRPDPMSRPTALACSEHAALKDYSLLKIEQRVFQAPFPMLGASVVDEIEWGDLPPKIEEAIAELPDLSYVAKTASYGGFRPCNGWPDAPDSDAPDSDAEEEDDDSFAALRA